MDKALLKEIRSEKISSPEELERITEWQRERQRSFRQAPDQGTEVEYLTKKFIVHRNVFSPFEDSKPLCENMRIKKGDSVLDMCTGSGVLGIMAAYKGAGKIVCLDISPFAVKCAEENARIHGFGGIIDVRLSDAFGAAHNHEKFDVILANLPLRNKQGKDFVEMPMWDSNLELHRKVYSGLGKHLKPNGSAFVSQANFGATEEMLYLAEENGFEAKLLAKHKPFPTKEIFYAFEFFQSKSKYFL